ncbi:MAG: hypothetical protein GX755_09690 [Syntrophomonadaceae bacterium]|nr:hypothetical protein [Syntrophomonadaceae bacterium]
MGFFRNFIPGAGKKTGAINEKKEGYIKEEFPGPEFGMEQWVNYCNSEDHDEE